MLGIELHRIHRQLLDVHVLLGGAYAHSHRVNHEVRKAVHALIALRGELGLIAARQFPNMPDQDVGAIYYPDAPADC